MKWWNALDARKDPMRTIAVLCGRGLQVHFLKQGRECTITKRSRVLWWGIATDQTDATPSYSQAALIDAVDNLRRDLNSHSYRQEIMA